MRMLRSMTEDISAINCGKEGLTHQFELYGAMSALTLNLGLDHPLKNPDPTNKSKKVLIQGASSLFGLSTIQLAHNARYTIVSITSTNNAYLVCSTSADDTVDQKL